MDTQIITLDELYTGKETIFKDKQYLNTKRYVEPFMEKMKEYTDDFIIKAVKPTQMSLSKYDDGTEIIAKTPDTLFNRVWIQAVMKEEFFFENNHRQTISMLYGLDGRNPGLKFYRGGLNMACTNLMVFNPDMLFQQGIKPEQDIDYKPLDRLIERNEECFAECKNYLDKLHDTFLDTRDKENELGKWVDYTLKNRDESVLGRVTLDSNVPIKAYKSLFLNNGNPYYRGNEQNVSYFDILNACTQVITDDKRDVINSFEKTKMISNMLGMDF